MTLRKRRSGFSFFAVDNVEKDLVSQAQVTLAKGYFLWRIGK
jgi:hypothetical protein